MIGIVRWIRDSRVSRFCFAASCLSALFVNRLQTISSIAIKLIAVPRTEYLGIRMFCCCVEFCFTVLFFHRIVKILFKLQARVDPSCPLKGSRHRPRVLAEVGRTFVDVPSPASGLSKAQSCVECGTALSLFLNHKVKSKCLFYEG